MCWFIKKKVDSNNERVFFTFDVWLRFFHCPIKVIKAHFSISNNHKNFSRWTNFLCLLVHSQFFNEDNCLSSVGSRSWVHGRTLLDPKGGEYCLPLTLGDGEICWVTPILSASCRLCLPRILSRVCVWSVNPLGFSDCFGFGPITFYLCTKKNSNPFSWVIEHMCPFVNSYTKTMQRFQIKYLDISISYPWVFSCC